MRHLNDIYNTEEHPLKGKLYKVPVQLGESVQHWDCSPWDSIPTMLEQHRLNIRKVTVTLAEEILFSSLTPLCLLLSKESQQKTSLSHSVSL